MSKEIVVSGIRPTGKLHLGNYFGAVQNFLKMQESYNCYFFIADYHSLTTHPTPRDLRDSVRQVFAEYLACGLDPEKSTLYIQSDLPETAELYMLLNMNAYIGELERCASFKDKIRTQPNNVNAGLLTYPVLMAADILIHHATKVPVGKDQEQHLEMARNFSNRFNHLFQTVYFNEPYAFNEGKELIKIPGLDGTGKMSKSESGMNAIFLADPPEMIRKKIMKAKTDLGPQAPTGPDDPIATEIQNLFDLMTIVSSADTLTHFVDAYKAATIRYGDLKKQLAEDMVKFVAPIGERIEAIKNDDKTIAKAAAIGKEKAHASAAKTIREVREIIGFRPLGTI